MPYNSDHHYFYDIGQNEGLVNSQSQYATTDTKNEVLTSGYFVNNRLKTGDKINAYTADGPIEMHVSSVDPIIEVTQFGANQNVFFKNHVVVATDGVGQSQVFDISGLLTTDALLFSNIGNVGQEVESYEITEAGKAKLYYEATPAAGREINIFIIRKN